MRQVDQIRDHLLTGRAITPLQAFDKFGCLRLAARIRDLRRQGFNIKTIPLTKNGKRFAAYRLENLNV